MPQAIDQLNIKVNNWRDLLTDAPFVRDDLVVIQCTDDLSKFNISQFHHVKHGLKIEDEGGSSSITSVNFFSFDAGTDYADIDGDIYLKGLGGMRCGEDRTQTLERLS